MKLAVAWDYPAERVLLDHVRWPVNGDVSAAVERFAAERAPHLASGRYGLRAAGYEVGVRLDRAAGTVFVLYVYRRR